MAEDASPSVSAKLAAAVAVAVVLLVATGVAWNAYATRSHPTRRPWPDAHRVGVQQHKDDGFYYFLVDSPEQADQISNLLDNEELMYGGVQNSSVSLVRSPQEKAAIMQSIHDTNSLRSGQGLRPIVVINLTNF